MSSQNPCYILSENLLCFVSLLNSPKKKKAQLNQKHLSDEPLL